jgi:hypothetical protein
MRRKTILSACTALRQALSASGLADLYHDMRDNPAAPAKSRNDRLLGAVLRFAPLAEKFDAQTSEVARILEFDFVQDPKWLIATLSGDEATVNRNLADFAFAMSLVETYLPKFTGLVRADAAEKFTTRMHADPAVGAQHDTLQVIVIDDVEERTPVDRMIAVLDSVRELYAVSCRLAGLDEALSVISLDSGGDKTIDFYGLAPAIAGTRDIMLSMWDKIVFYRSNKGAERNRLVAENLSVLWEIQALKETGKLAAEEAEILRRRTIDAALQFLDAGATIPEIQDRAVFEPRALMAPANKMLTNGSGEAAKPAVAEPAKTEDDFDDSDLFAPAAAAAAAAPVAAPPAARSELTPDEMRGLQRFLNREIKTD